MADFLVDPFTGTPGGNLTGTTAPTGGLWAEVGVGVGFTGGGNKVYSTAGTTHSYNGAAPPSADYEVEVVISRFDADNARAMALGRASTGDFARYEWGLNVNTGFFELRVRDAGGTVLDLASDNSVTMLNSTDYTAKLSMIGTAIKGYVDGVLKCSVTDTSVVLAGKAGVAIYGTSSGITQIDSIRAGAVAPSETVVPTYADLPAPRLGQLIEGQITNSEMTSAVAWF